jgi:hypothetical protein
VAADHHVLFLFGDYKHGDSAGFLGATSNVAIDNSGPFILKFPVLYGAKKSSSASAGPYRQQVVAVRNLTPCL